MACPEIDKTVRNKYKTKKDGGIKKGGGGRVTRASAKRLRGLLDARSEANARSRLLSLPGELRNRIYEYAIGGNEVLLHSEVPDQLPFAPRAAPYQRSWNFRADSWNDLFALGRVCRQLNLETKVLPFKHNIFLVAIGSEARSNLAALTASKRGSITTISCMGNPSYFPNNVTFPTTPSDLDELTGLKRIILKSALIGQEGGGLVTKYAEERGIMCSKEKVLETFEDGTLSSIMSSLLNIELGKSTNYM